MPFKIVVSADPSLSKKDTIIFLKARTSGGKDTILKAVPVHKQPPENSTVLLEKFYQQLQKQPQRFQVDNRRDTIISGQEGTTLYIPANSFEAKENVTVLLTEFYSIDDMIMNKLTTTSGGQALVTGGMIYLDARNNNDELVDLKKGALLTLDMKKRDNQQPMELFYGYDYYRNDITNVLDSISWKPTNQLFRSANKKTFESFKTSPNRRIVNKVDTVWITNTNKEGDGPPLGYLLRDSIAGISIPDRKLDSIAMQRFGVNVNRLGWINCDRFYKDPRPKVELIVDLGDNPDNYNAILVFDNLASILPRSSRQGNLIRFSNLPEGEAARVIVMGIKNEKPVTAMKKLLVSTATINDLKFEEIATSDFKDKLKK